MSGRTGLAPIASVSRRQGVVDELRRGIVLGTIRPGERLTEASLSKVLEVSRPTVREAMNQVAQEGLVVQEPYRGMRVAELDADQVLDIARVRLALDMQAASEILADDTGRRLALVVAAWDRYVPQLVAEDPLQQHDAHMVFHRELWEAAESDFLMRLWPVVQAHLTIALARDQAARQDPERSRLVHRAIVEAFERRDLDAVRAAFTEHTLGSARELARLLSAGRDDDAVVR